MVPLGRPDITQTRGRGRELLRARRGGRERRGDTEEHGAAGTRRAHRGASKVSTSTLRRVLALLPGLVLGSNLRVVEIVSRSAEGESQDVVLSRLKVVRSTRSHRD